MTQSKSLPAEAPSGRASRIWSAAKRIPLIRIAEPRRNRKADEIFGTIFSVIGGLVGGLLPTRQNRSLRGRALPFLIGYVRLLASLVVVYAMFHAAQTEFETIVVCALVLVYCAVVWNAIVLGRALAALERVNYARFLDLRTLAGHSTEPDEAERLRALGRQVEEPGAAFWVNAVGMSIASFWALWHLIATLVT